MGKAKKKVANWAEHNKALCKRGSVTFWIDDSAGDVKPIIASVGEAFSTLIQRLKLP